MNNSEIISMLASKPFFIGMTDKDISDIVTHCAIKKYKKGDVIIREGELSRIMYVILNGSVSIYKGDIEEGVKLIELESDDKLITLYKGTFFGEMSVIDLEPRSASVIAKDEAELIEINFEKLNPLFLENTDILVILMQNIGKMLSRRLRRMDEIMYEMTKKRELVAPQFHTADQALDAIKRGKAVIGSVNRKHQPNFMTIGWGMLGNLWNIPVFGAFVRPSRYTYKNLKKSGIFTVSVFFNETHNDLLKYCGSVSFKDEHKVEKMNIPYATTAEGTPYVSDADLVYECKIISTEKLHRVAVPEDVIKSFYASGDLHSLFFGEIIRVIRTSS